MSCGHESLQIGYRTVCRIYLQEVHRGVRAVHHRATWVDGHQPEDIHTKGVQPCQLPFGSLEGSLWGEGTHVELVDDAVLL